MIIIRFLRTGKRNQAFFRVVATDKKNPPKAGRFLEILGFYNPLTKEKNLKADRIKYWISKGAQTSDTVHNLLIQEGVIQGKKIPKHGVSKKSENNEQGATNNKEEIKTEEKKEEKTEEQFSGVEKPAEPAEPESAEKSAETSETEGAEQPEENKEPPKTAEAKETREEGKPEPEAAKDEAKAAEPDGAPNPEQQTEQQTEAQKIDK